MKKLFYSSILLFCLLLSWYCQKRIIGKAHFTGTVIDWFNNKPIEVEINVSAYKKLGFGTLREETIGYGNYPSSSDGSFDFKIKSAKSDHYLLYFSEKNVHPMLSYPNSFFRNINVSNKETMDFGTMTDMAHVFICKAIVTYTSSSSNHIVFTTNNTTGNIDLPPRTNTTVLFAQPYTQENYESNNYSFIVNYKLTDVVYPYEVYKSINAPLGTNDTVMVNVSY